MSRLKIIFVSLLMLHFSLGIVQAAAEDFVPQKTKADSAQEIVQMLTQAARSDGAQILFIFAIIALMIVLTVYYGLARMLPVFALVLVAGGLVYGVFTLNREKPSQIKADAEIQPIEVTVTPLSETSVTLNWRTAKSTLGSVNYGTLVGALDFSSFEEPYGNKATTHQVVLDGLTRGKLYYYEILSNGQAFNDDNFFFQF